MVATRFTRLRRARDRHSRYPNSTSVLGARSRSNAETR
jgi:hypothetical protein